jgi:hypothetical protein
MKSQNLTFTFTVDQTPEEAFAAINNVRGWWSGEIEGTTDKLGAEWSYRYKDIHYSKQRITELTPGKKVVWLVVDSYLQFVEDKKEWNGTEVAFDIAKKGNQTEVRFTHRGLNPDRVLRRLLKRVGLLHQHQPAQPDRIRQGSAQQEREKVCEDAGSGAGLPMIAPTS